VKCGSCFVFVCSFVEREYLVRNMST